MRSYVVDEYVDRPWNDEAVIAEYVASWRVTKDAGGNVSKTEVELHPTDVWAVRSEDQHHRKNLPRLLAEALERNGRGRVDWAAG